MSRIKWIDYARAFGIILVVLGHMNYSLSGFGGVLKVKTFMP